MKDLGGSDDLQETIGVSMRDGTMASFPVGVGKGGIPIILPVRDGLLINDEHALTVLRSDGSKFIRRRGRILELCDVHVVVSWGRQVVVEQEVEERLENKRLYTYVFEGGGTSAFLELANGAATQLFAQNLAIKVHDRTLEIFGTYARRFEC